MATTGTTDFNLSGGEFIAYAYSLCGIRRTALEAEHMEDARTALNLLMSSWGPDTPNLWTVELVSVELQRGVASYAVPEDTIMILDAYIRNGDLANTASLNDRIIWPLSRTAYAAMADKNTQSPPTSFWFDRTLSPSITLWPIPNLTSTPDEVNQLQYYRCVVVQDSDPKNGIKLDIPRWWQIATAFGLAELLAFSYAKDRVADLKIKAKEMLQNAREQDVENVPMTIAPSLGGYYQR